MHRLEIKLKSCSVGVLHMKLTDAQSYSGVLTLLSTIDDKCLTYSRNSLRLFLSQNAGGLYSMKREYGRTCMFQIQHFILKLIQPPKSSERASGH